MTDVTRILSAIEQGDATAAGQLLPLVYEELRKLAAQKLAQEKPGQTLEATALVHEAYLRLVASPGRESGEEPQQWNSRGHFFAAAAEAMRRILVDNARRKKSKKRGGDRVRLDLDDFPAATSERLDDVLDIDAAAERRRWGASVLAEARAPLPPDPRRSVRGALACPIREVQATDVPCRPGRTDCIQHFNIKHARKCSWRRNLDSSSHLARPRLCKAGLVCQVPTPPENLAGY
jgi:RNA polymerase sigma factor (TIGR02999 family)